MSHPVLSALSYRRAAPSMEPQQAAQWLARALATSHRTRAVKRLASKR